MKHIKIAYLISILLTVTLVSFQNCSDVGFSTKTAEDSKPVFPLCVDKDNCVEPPINPPPTETHTETFTSERSAEEKEVDMVWVIDNSGSMGEEAAHVRENFEAFENYMAAQVGIKLALLSSTSTTYDNGVIMSNAMKANGHIQIDQRVDSRDAWIMAGLALCPLSESDYCDEALAIENQSGSSDPGKNYDSIRGKLVDFWRPDAHKVFVIVTDDESDIFSSTFLSVFDNFLPDESLSIYGFVGISYQLSPCIDKVGTIHKNLINQTGGSYFNVCDTDWTDHFSDLADQVVSEVDRRFNLSQANVYQITKVIVNGVELTSNLYTLDNGFITIDASVMPSGVVATYTIEVTYEALL